MTGGSSIHSCILRLRDGPMPSSSVRDRFASTKSYASSGHKNALRAARRSGCCKWPLACSASRAKIDLQDTTGIAVPDYMYARADDNHSSAPNHHQQSMVDSIDARRPNLSKIPARFLVANACGRHWGRSIGGEEDHRRRRVQTLLPPIMRVPLNESLRFFSLRPDHLLDLVFLLRPFRLNYL